MEENIILKIKNIRLSLTDTEKVIADYFLAKKPPMSIKKMSKELSVSTSTISRFVKKVGLSNYKEFIFLYKNALNSSNKLGDNLAEVSSEYINILDNIKKTYNDSNISKVCELIYENDVVHFYGGGFNKYSCNDIAFRYAKIGKYLHVIEDLNMLALQANITKTKGLYIIITLRAESKKLEDIVKKMSCSNDLVLITSNKVSEMVKYVDVLLLTSPLSTKHTLGNISPQLPILLQLDLIFNYYIQRYTDSIDDWKASETILKEKK